MEPDRGQSHPLQCLGEIDIQTVGINRGAVHLDEHKPVILIRLSQQELFFRLAGFVLTQSRKARVRDRNGPAGFLSFRRRKYELGFPFAVAMTVIDAPYRLPHL